MDINYEFCRSAKLTPFDLLVWLDLDQLLDVDGVRSHKFFGRNMMIVDSSIRISCIHEDFNRWANSEEFLFDIADDIDKNAFIDWVIQQRKVQGYYE